MLTLLKNGIQSVLNLVGYQLVRSDRTKCARVRMELRRLGRSADFSVDSTDIIGKPLKVVSNRAFVYLYEEIIAREIYRFSTERSDPYIVDCGANIGLSTIFFKRLYPNAKVICFEPDARTFDALSRNVAIHAPHGVQLINKGVWNKNATVAFRHDPQSTASRIVEDISHGESKVEVVRLRDYLNEPVDFLKIDIEGAESTVIPDIADRLPNVRNIFIEYHSSDECEDTLHVILSLLHASGFTVFLENGCPLPDSPFVDNRLHKGFRLLVNIYGVRDSSGMAKKQ